jgi:hypothetical protein
MPLRGRSAKLDQPQGLAMAAREKTILRVSVGIVAAGLLTFTPLSPASAKNIFEMLFGGFHREAPAGLPTNLSSFADPFAAPQNAPLQRTETGPATGYCVRTCDGHYFPVQAHAGVGATEACHSFCPASPTRLYSGAAIDHAVAADGSHYADLDTAFLYRQQLVAGCTCNGRDAFGLARADISTDPTLRPGDIVATKSGLVAFTGMKNKVADFTPIDGNRGVSKSTREKLSDVKIMPPNPGAPKATPVTLGGHARADDNRSVQLAR